MFLSNGAFEKHQLGWLFNLVPPVKKAISWLKSLSSRIIQDYLIQDILILNRKLLTNSDVNHAIKLLLALDSQNAQSIIASCFIRPNETQLQIIYKFLAVLEFCYYLIQAWWF